MRQHTVRTSESESVSVLARKTFRGLAPHQHSSRQEPIIGGLLGPCPPQKPLEYHMPNPQRKNVYVSCTRIINVLPLKTEVYSCKASSSTRKETNYHLLNVEKITKNTSSTMPIRQNDIHAETIGNSVTCLWPAVTDGTT